MNMKSFILRFLLVSCFFAVVPSCASREDFEQLEQRVDELGREMDQLSMLVQQINSGGYVVAVIPDEDGNGYTLAFNDGSTVHINLAAKSSGNTSQGDGQDGSSTQSTGGGITFSSVDTSNPDYVVIILSDGTVLSLPTWSAFAALQQQVKQMNINLSALSHIVSALQDNDYLISTTPMVEDGVQVGWLLNFSKSGLVVIYSIDDTASPQIGVRQDSDGVYYWTLDGEWLQDSEGRKVRAEGAKGDDAVTPRLKIEEQFWWISYDDGETWTQLGKASGEDGDSFFQEVDQTNEEFVRLVLYDGTVINIPRYVPLDIQLSLPSEKVMGPYEDWYVPYKIVGTNKEDASLAVFGQGGLNVALYDDETIWIGSTNNTGGSFVVLLSVPSGVTVMKSFTIDPRVLVVYWGSYTIPLPYSGATVYLEQAGREMYLHCLTNASFSLDFSEVPWAKLVQCTPCEDGYDIQLSISPNGNEPRTGHLFFTFEDQEWSGRKSYAYGNDVSRYYIILNQDGAGAGDITQDVLEVQADLQSKVYEIEVNSSAESLSARPDESCTWLSCSMEKKTQDIWTLFVDVAGCPASSSRSSMVYISAGGQDIGSMLVEQKDLHLDEEAMIKMEVLSLPENGHKVILPFSGQLSLRVDWGDGCVSIFERGLNNKDIPFIHKYQDSEGIGHYTISALGTVQKMTSSSVSDFVTVESVLQWGADLGLESMAGAFYNVKTLKSISEDKYGVFSQVMTFSSAFQSCSALVDVPVNLFDAACMATNFEKAFSQVKNVTSESPYVLVGGQKVHLYERKNFGQFANISKYISCFYCGNWADQKAIHEAGWD